MDAKEFKKRTQAFAVKIIKFVEALPYSATTHIISKQLLRSATSVGANYRSACRAKSRADFVAKMGIVEEECDESLYWMELLVESGRVKQTNLGDSRNESNEILSLVVTSIRTARSRK